MQQGGERYELVSPSFRDISVEHSPAAAGVWDSPTRISAVEHYRHRPDQEEGDEEDKDDYASEEFEFSFALKDPEAGLPAAADELFSFGRISPVYPVFNRNLLLAGAAGGEKAAEDQEKAVRIPLGKLLLEEREEATPATGTRASSPGAEMMASSQDELEGVPPETYCAWAPRSVRPETSYAWAPGSVPPSPARCRKSGSTGSASFRLRIRDFVMGRSHSDGKEKFLFFEAAEAKVGAPVKEEKKEEETPRKSPPTRETAAKGKKKGGKVTEIDVVTAHGIYYGRGRQEGKGGRRSFLPYKQDIIGFFVNVNGISRQHHPF